MGDMFLKYFIKPFSNGLWRVYVYYICILAGNWTNTSRIYFSSYSWKNQTRIFASHFLPLFVNPKKIKLYFTTTAPSLTPTFSSQRPLKIFWMLGSFLMLYPEVIHNYCLPWGLLKSCVP